MYRVCALLVWPVARCDLSEVFMPTQEEIEQQQELLATHRRTLAHLLKQAAQYGGEVYAPTHLANSIAEARTNIQRIKQLLRDWGAAVEDRSDDKEASPTQPARQHLPTQKTISGRNNVPLIAGLVVLLISIIVIALVVSQRNNPISAQAPTKTTGSTLALSQTHTVLPPDTPTPNLPPTNTTQPTAAPADTPVPIPQPTEIPTFTPEPPTWTPEPTPTSTPTGCPNQVSLAGEGPGLGNPGFITASGAQVFLGFVTGSTTRYPWDKAELADIVSRFTAKDSSAIDRGRIETHIQGEKWYSFGLDDNAVLLLYAYNRTAQKRPWVAIRWRDDDDVFEFRSWDSDKIRQISDCLVVDKMLMGNPHVQISVFNPSDNLPNRIYYKYFVAGASGP
jgi:hypothetical protein